MNGFETQLNSPARRNRQSQASRPESPPSRSSRGGVFSRLLSDAGLTFGRSPMAHVTPGNSVTFSGLPFFDQFGNTINPDDPSTFRRTVEAHRSRRPPPPDARSHRELALSSNDGAAQLMPEFRKRALEHLLLTDDLRSGILSGELETPGNRSYVLRKKLEVERQKVEVKNRQVWLQEARTILQRSPKGDAARLTAQAKTLQESEAGSERVARDLPDPRLPRVERFQPPRIHRDERQNTVQRPGSRQPQLFIGPSPEPPDSLEPVHGPEADKTHRKPVKGRAAGGADFKREIGDKPPLDPVRTDKPAELRPALRSDLLSRLRVKTGVPIAGDSRSPNGLRGDGDGLNTPKQVSRVQVSPMTEAESAVIRQQLSQPSTAVRAGQPSPLPENDPKSAAHAVTPKLRPAEPPAVAPISPLRQRNSDQVRTMQKRGWRLHTPTVRDGKVERSHGDQPGAVKQAKVESDRGARPGKKAAVTSRTTRAARAAGGKETGTDGKPGVTAAFVTGFAAAWSARNGRAAPGPGQGLQNLHELMRKIASQAKVLKGDGVLKLQVALKPAKLGSVLLSVIRSNGKYLLTMTVERSDAAKSLEHHLPALKAHLANLGIQVERVQIETLQERQQQQTAPDGQRRETADSGSRRPVSRHGKNGESKLRSQDKMDDSSRRAPLATGTNTVEYLG